MSYTKRNLNTITLLLTILIFICLNLLNYQISLLFQNAYSFNFNDIYSRKISIEKQSNTIQASDINDTSENTQTQREIIKENETNTWRILIPKLDLDVHIEEGTTPGVLLKAVGHFEESSKWNGNVCLAAHNRGYQCNFFQKIKQLKIGDEIIYCTENGERVYKVQTNKVILETDWSYIEATKENAITLITCEENRSEYRRCIQAVQIMDI